MKIYKAKVTYALGPGNSLIGGITMCRPGEFLYESPGYVADSIIYKPEGGGYPLSKETVEGKPDEFELVREETEHDADYYLKCIYTQFQVDQMNKNKQQ